MNLRIEDGMNTDRIQCFHHQVESIFRDGDAALGHPCLDLEYYVAACRERDGEPAAAAMRAKIEALKAQYPDWREKMGRLSHALLLSEARKAEIGIYNKI